MRENMLPRIVTPDDLEETPPQLLPGGRGVVRSVVFLLPAFEEG